MNKTLVNTIYYTSMFRKSNIVEQPTLKISVDSNSGSADCLYDGSTVALEYMMLIFKWRVSIYNWTVTNWSK